MPNEKYKARTMREMLDAGEAVSTAAMHREQAREEGCNPNCNPPSCRWCEKAASAEVSEMSQRVAKEKNNLS